jgi:anti-sigma regulatory factor (Ser/Thr protein kinase)
MAGEPVTRYRADLPGGLSAPAQARRLVAGWIGGDLDRDTLYDIQVLVSELVTNAVRHGGGGEGGRIALGVRMARERLRIDVGDSGPGFERPRPPKARPEGGGNGLLLLEILTSRWDVSLGAGTTVWFELDREAA